MTNNEMMNAYNKFLATYCDCYADSEGNRPCDNGALCDRCMTKEAQEIWNKIKEEIIMNESKLNNPYFVYSVGDVFKNDNGEEYIILALDEEKDKAILIKDSKIADKKYTQYIGAKGLRMHHWAHGHYFMTNLMAALEWFAEDEDKKNEIVTPEYITVKSVVETFLNPEFTKVYIHDYCTTHEYGFMGDEIPDVFLNAKIEVTSILDNYNCEEEVDLALGAFVFYINSRDNGIDMDDVCENYGKWLV